MVNIIRGVLGVSVLTLATACSLPQPADADPSEAGNSGGTPNGNGKTDPSQQGTHGEPNGGGFLVKGSVAVPQSAGLRPLDVGGGSGAVKRATHIMAVTPSSQNTKRVVAEIGPKGEFSIDLDPARLWVLVFVDSTRVGSDMIVGVFRAKGLDTLAPSKKGAADLGAVSSADGTSAASLPYEDLLAAMGIDPASALFLSSVDDLCLRVVNPDVDGNGKIDALEEHKDYRLDFHVQFRMQTDHNVAVTDVIEAFLPDTVSLSYGGTAIYTSFPSKLFSDSWKTTASASFDEELHYSVMSPSGPTEPQVAAPGSTIPTADLIISGYGDYGSVGVMASPGFNLPQENYRFGLNETTLSFTNIKTPTDAQLAAAENFIMPFINFRKTDSACSSACTLSGIDYVWRKRVEGGWIPATAGEIAILAGEQGGFVSIRLGGDESKNIGFTIPATSTSGTIPWSDVNTPDAGLKTAALAAKTTELCHIGLSYDDKLGMRYFGSIEDAVGTCGR